MKRWNTFGYSLIELMIALTLGLILAASIVQAVLAAGQHYRVSQTLARIMEGGHFALDLIASDIRRAGYWGLFTASSGEGTGLGVGGTLSTVEPNPRCELNVASWAKMIDRPLLGFNDSAVDYDCISGSDYLRGDILLSRHVTSLPIGIAGKAVAGRQYRDGGIYLRGGMSEAKLFRGRDKLADRNELDVFTALDYPLKIHAYYVGLTNRRCRGERIPALFRKKLTATGKRRREELVEGIENIQFQYLIDGQYVDASQAINWSSVSAVKVWVLSRAICPEEGLTNGAAYRLGDQNFSPEDASSSRQYRRKLYSGVFSIRNTL